MRREATPVDRLARFLVLAEKWPAVVNYILEKRASPTFWAEQRLAGTSGTIAQDILSLPDEERKKLVELLMGQGESDPLQYADLESLAAWSGFDYYRGVASTAANGSND